MPYWRLSSFYFFYFAVLGVLVPYWPKYLASIGFGAEHIGILMALPMLARIPAPAAWGWLADHYGRHMPMVRIAALLTWLTFLALFAVTSFWWVGLAMFVFAFFWHASLPLLEATTMSHVGGNASRYGRVRWWGSFGFIVAVMALGATIESGGPVWIPYVMLAFMLTVFVTSLMLPDAPSTDHSSTPKLSLRQVLARPEVIALFATCVLLQASHGPYYTFFTIYLGENGYSETRIALLWALSVFAEVGAFLVMQPLLKVWSARAALLASVALTGVRWLLIGFFPENLGIVVLAQLLHAFSFGVAHSVCMLLVHQYFTGRLQNRGQGLYGSLTFGLGGAIGAIYSGQVWEAIGPAGAHTVAAIIAAVAFFIAWAWIRPKS
jgi:MFS transporter, PPP family, 3-phenylpropionic acid transporter